MSEPNISVTITTETDLITGDRIYILPLPQVPITTPVGYVAGDMRIEVSKDGRVIGVGGVLKPPAAALRDAADAIAKSATFPLQAGQLRALGDAESVAATFMMTAPALTTLAGVRVNGTMDLDEVFSSPTLLDLGAFALTDLVASREG